MIEAIPKGVLDKVQKLSNKYLWAGQNASGGIHLASWNSVVTPKEFGGWGLKDIFPFAWALAGKKLWILTQGNSLWVRVMCSKYMAIYPLRIGFVPWTNHPKAPSFGKPLVEAFPLIGKWTVWKIGNGHRIRVGEDPWLGAR
jgi:hypothetical protein